MWGFVYGPFWRNEEGDQLSMYHQKHGTHKFVVGRSVIGLGRLVGRLERIQAREPAFDCLLFV